MLLCNREGHFENQSVLNVKKMCSSDHPKSSHSASLLFFSRYKVAVTKHKDLEQTSSSLYSQNNIWSPTVDFSKYIEDNESIEDEVR